MIQGNRRVIVGGRGFENLEALLGLGFDLDDATDPGSLVVRSKRTQVFADVSDNPTFAGAPEARRASAAGSVRR